MKTPPCGGVFCLEVAHFDLFAHLFQIFGKLLYQAYFDAEGNGQIRVLVRRIDGLSDKEIDVRGIIEQKLGDLLGSVRLHAPQGGKVGA